MQVREWHFRRNCSLSPRQLGGFYMSLCGASLTVAGYFAARGAWFVLLFAFLELAAVGAAFLLYARHATDRERIALADDCLLVELVRADNPVQFRFDPQRTRVSVPDRGRELVGLVESGAPDGRVEVGRYLDERRRREFARELLQEMHRINR